MPVLTAPVLFFFGIACRCRYQYVVGVSTNAGARRNAGEASYRPEGL